jgi:uncharacterized protein (DUF2249 family)
VPAAGEAAGGGEALAAAAPGGEPAPRPAELDGRAAVVVDVRDDIRRGEEPLARIVAAAKSLGAADALAVRAPFEPVPLYDVLGRRGLVHWTEQLADADWRVWFYRRAADVARPAADAAGVPGDARPVPAAAPAVLDVRGLEPPLPMVRVLEQLDRLPPGGVLRVLHQRRPMFLYPQLDDRGFTHETCELEPGLVQIVIRRPEA